MRRSRARRALTARLCLALLAAAAPLQLFTALAQDSNTGGVRGRLVFAPRSGGNSGRTASADAEGLTPVPNVSVELIDPRTNRVISGAETDRQGRFHFPPVAFGDYVLGIHGSNTVSERVSVFVMDVREFVVQIDKLPGREAQAAPIQIVVLKAEQNLTDARRQGAYLARTTDEVPLGGASLTRSFDEMAFYAPGIAAPPQTLSNYAGPGFGAGVGTAGQFSANGLRSRANNFTVDGSDNNDEDVGVRRQGFLALVPQPVESLHEYQVITALAPAQVGRNLGAQVNAVSQYGTERHRGALYATGSSHVFNAADFFDAAGGGETTIPLTAQVDGAARPVFVDGRREFVTNGAGRKDRFAFLQGGATIGGPIRRATDAHGLQLFYFASGEYQRLRSTKETHFAVPTVEERGLLGSGAAGLSRDPFTGAALDAFPTSAQGDAIFSFFPFPNNPQGVYGRNTYTRELPSDGLGVIAAGRVDGSRELFGRVHQFIARYNFTEDYRDVPTVAGALFSTVRPHIRTQTFSLFGNSFLRPSSPAVVANQVFVSYGRTNIDFEERRDTGFLSPTGVDISDPDERRFLLNAPILQNVTRPGMSEVRYVTDPRATAEQRLGTPFEDVASPVGQIIIAGFSPVGVDVFTFPQRRTNNTYQASDTLTVLAGSHSLAFGADVRRSELNSRLPRNARPLILFSGGGKAGPLQPDGTREAIGRFSALDVAATGAANGVVQTLTTGDDSTLGLRYYQLNFFGRDEWRVRPNLSLSFGLRYEYNTPPSERHGRIERTFNSPVLATVGLDQFIQGRRRIFDPDRNNFAPRLGLAYAFGAYQQNVLRFGGGVYYDQAPGVVVSQSRSVVPTFLTFNTAGFFQFDEISPGVFGPVGLGIRVPSNLVTTVGCRAPNFIQIREPGTLNTIDPRASVPCILDEYLFRRVGGGFVPVLQTVLPVKDFEMPTAYHFSASYEREVAREAYVSVAYVGTRGRHLLRQTTPNLGDQSPTGLFALFITHDRPRFGGIIDQPSQLDAEGVQRARPSPDAGAVRLYETSADSRYDALQLQLRGPLARAASYQLNYTLSKVTDDSSDVFDLAGSPSLPQNSLTRAGEYSYANFDARHVLSGYLSYTMPSRRSGPSRLRDFLRGGWQITAKTRYQSGQPFTVNTVKDINKDGNLTDRPNTAEGIVVTGDRERPLVLTVDPNTILARGGQDGALGRNTFRAGGRFDLDLSLLKRVTFAEGDRSLSFRLDVFNLTNRANFGIPVRYLEAPGFGRATNTVTLARRLQFSLKFEY